MIRIKRNSDGTSQVDMAAHTASLTCDVCGAAADNVNLNSVAIYGKNADGASICVSLKCADLGGTCDSVTCWPLSGGTEDAQNIAQAKTA